MCTASLTSFTVANMISGRAVLVVQTCNNPTEQKSKFQLPGCFNGSAAKFGPALSCSKNNIVESSSVSLLRIAC